MHSMRMGAVLMSVLLILTVFASGNASASYGSLVKNYILDNGWDSDGNGFYNKLNVTIFVNVTIPGYFGIQADLKDSSTGRTIDNTGFQGNLGAGNNSVFLQFDGKKIRYSAVDGPYQVYIRLYNDTSLNIIDTAQYLTSPYRYVEFEPYSLEYTGVHTDYAFSTDSDPRFDILRVNVSFYAWKTGQYQVSAYLKSFDGRVSIDYFLSSMFYVTMGNTIVVSLDFKGPSIFSSGCDGQYRIRMGWYDQSEAKWYWNIPEFMTNNAYNHTWFQSNIEITKMTEHVRDTDGDSFYDELALDFDVKIVVPGAYGLLVTVRHGTGYYLVTNAGDFGDLYTSSGNYTISCALDIGYKIDRHTANASFIVDVTKRQYSNGAWTSLSKQTFTTAKSYNSSDFARKLAQAKLVGTPYCEFIDHDGDGKFDWIDAIVNISCGVEDSFILKTYLKNYSNWKDVTWGMREIRTVPGVIQAHVRMPAWPVNASKVNSPYRVGVELFTADWNTELSFYIDGVISTPYNSTDFNGTPPVELTLVDDFGMDYNGNGKYDFLVVQLRARATEFNTGSIMGILKNGTTTIGSYEWFGNLYADSETPVVLYYPGIKIRKEGIVSPYRLELSFTDYPEYHKLNLEQIDLAHSYSPEMFEDPAQTLLRGQLIDEKTLAPIADASINCTSHVWGSNSTTTNSTGWFSMNVSSGLVTLSIAKSGYQPRTVYMEATGAVTTRYLGLTTVKTDDSMIRGFIKLRDGSPVPPLSTAAGTLLYLGEHRSKDFMIGPNGYYEISAITGTAILFFYNNKLPECGSFRVELPTASVYWKNFTMRIGNSESDSHIYLLTDWNHGRFEFRSSFASYNALIDALSADLFCGDSNGIVSADEARLFALYKYRSYRYFDSSQRMIVNDTCYFFDRGRMSFNAEDMLGALENIVSVRYTISGSFSTRTNLGSEGQKEIKILMWYDYRSSIRTYTHDCRIQLPAGFGLVGVKSSANGSVSGESLISINPGGPLDRIYPLDAFILQVSTSTAEPESCTFIGRALLADSESHGGILITVLDKDGDTLESTFTDDAGNYFMIGLPCEELVVKATRAGYHPAGAIARPDRTGLISVPDILLHPATIINFVGGLNCTVMDDAGNRVRNATIMLRYLENSTLIASLVTDENGRFEIHGLTPGAITINITAEGYPAFGCLEFVNGLETIEKTYVLTLPTGSITGRILDDQGNAHEGIVVKLFDSAGNLVMTTTTDAQGYFSFQHVKDGTYNISIFWQDKEIGNVTDVVVSGGNVTDIGTVSVPASAFGAQVDIAIFVIAAAAIIAIILGILWFMRRPPAKKEPSNERREAKKADVEEKIESELEVEPKIQKPRKD